MLWLNFRLRSKTKLSFRHGTDSFQILGNGLFAYIYLLDYVFSICLMVVISYAITRINPIRSGLASMENHNLQGLWFIRVWKSHSGIKPSFITEHPEIPAPWLSRGGYETAIESRQWTLLCCAKLTGEVAAWVCWVGVGQQRQKMTWLFSCCWPQPGVCVGKRAHLCRTADIEDQHTLISAPSLLWGRCCL